jgi:hypothetical protein
MEYVRYVEATVLLKMVQLCVTLLPLFTVDLDVLLEYCNVGIILAFMNHNLLMNFVMFRTTAF